MLRIGFGLALGLGMLAFGQACGSKSGGSSSSGATSGGSCVPTDPACPALKVQSDCLALTDNKGLDHFVLRLSQLEVTAPPALTSKVVSDLIGKGVAMKLDSCNLFGDGTFSLITEYDLKAGTLRTGGALPVTNPADGYCYANDMANGVAPVQVAAKFSADLKFTIDPVKKIVLPVYQPGMGTNGAILLPLSNVTLGNAQISADHNCIGKYNGDKLQPSNNCLPDLETKTNYFTNGATLDGIITLEEADAVKVPQLSSTLCVLLVGTNSDDVAKYVDSAASPKKCKRTDGKTIDLKGDWCATTNMAGGCADSFHLTANLAASAAKLKSSCP